MINQSRAFDLKICLSEGCMRLKGRSRATIAKATRTELIQQVGTLRFDYFSLFCSFTSASETYAPCRDRGFDVVAKTSSR
jgi:hypothetical protein